MTKQDYINAIHKVLKTEHYQVMYAPYYDPNWPGCNADNVYEFETKRQAVAACKKYGWSPDKIECLIEFYEHWDSDVRTDCMHGKNEMDCLKELYRIL